MSREVSTFIFKFSGVIGSLILIAGCSGGFSPMQTPFESNGSSSAPLTPEQKAFETFVRSDCDMCHGTRPGDGNVYLYDTAALIATGWLVPGDTASSAMYVNTGPGHNGRVLSPADRIIVADWIMSLASPTPTPSPTATPRPTATPMPTATPPGATPAPTPMPTPAPTPTPSPTPLTRDQFYSANVGPNGSSVDSLLSVNRCMRCHYSGGSTYDPQATAYLIIAPNDPAGNLARIKAVNVGGVVYDMSKAINGNTGHTIYQFSVGHKAKNPAYSAAELQHIMNYVKMP
ncbi:MAG: hypothetical protein V4760_15455 [Bdellovibrionota bacterium]